MLRVALASLLTLAVGCSSATPHQAKKRTLPEPLVAADLPPDPKDEQEIPSAANWVVSCAGYVPEGEVEDGQASEPVMQAGICMSFEKAARAGRYVVRYDELRGLYLIDLRTWGRERQIYERHLELAQQEADAWKEKSKRTWMERNAGPLGLAVGVVVGIVATAVGTAAIKKAAE